jgi:protein TonB
MAFSLAGTGSDSTALAVGNAIIPASPDKAFRNRPPVYPEAAAVLGQHGAVWVMIHVSPQGLPVGADIVQSSGYPLLDRSARDAVMRWHFLPAVKDGQPIPFDMPMRFLFEID